MERLPGGLDRKKDQHIAGAGRHESPNEPLPANWHQLRIYQAIATMHCPMPEFVRFAQYQRMSNAPQNRDGRTDARAIFDAGVAGVQPAAVMNRARFHDLIDVVRGSQHVFVVGGGKAGPGMALALESLLEGNLDRIHGIVNVPNETARSTRRIILHRSRPMGTNEPTPAAAAGVEQMLELIAAATESDVVIVLLSGGGSALLPAPVTGISLQEKTLVTRLLSNAGATIQEMNCVRKHLSRIKGGRLAEAACKVGSIWSLIISDVVGDAIDVIASGPTAPDPTTFADVWEVIKRFHLVDSIPPTVAHYLKLGTAGQVPETPKHLPDRVHNAIIACNADALRSAEAEARRRDYNVTSLADAITGNTIDVAKTIAEITRNLRTSRKRTCLLFGGETTPVVGRNSGLGGRAQELVLALGCEFDEVCLEHVTILVGGTDGEDGPTDAAGAILDHSHWCEAKSLGINARDYLNGHDSYHFFEPIRGLIKTGLTGTNVMDLGIILSDPL